LNLNYSPAESALIVRLREGIPPPSWEQISVIMVENNYRRRTAANLSRQYSRIKQR
jgi:hypothetical protein